MAQKIAPSAKKAANIPLSHGVGRRKRAVARVWLRRGNGKIRVNGAPHDIYFDTETSTQTAATPFAVMPTSVNYDVQVNVQGGGKVAQADAVKLGIARAFVKLDEGSRTLLRKHDLLTVDARKKERKKYGQLGARRKFQFVKR